MATGNNIKAIARKTQTELGINYTTALRAVQAAPAPHSGAEREAAKDPRTDPAVLHVIASRPLRDSYDGFNQEDAAANPSSSVLTLRWLADGPAVDDSWVQDKLLSNPSTPEDVLLRFMFRDGAARERLAQNIGARDELVLDVLAVDPRNHAAEYWASQNTGLSDETREYVNRMRTTESWRRHVDEATAAELRKTFRGWLKLQENRQDPIGDLARDAAADPEFPAVDDWDAVEAYLDYTAAYPAAVEAWAEYTAGQ